jgi:hypothetical protein
MARHRVYLVPEWEQYLQPLQLSVIHLCSITGKIGLSRLPCQTCAISSFITSPGIMAGHRGQAVRKREQIRVVGSGLTLKTPVIKHRHFSTSADVLGHRETPASQPAFPFTSFAALGWCVIRTAL